MTCPKCGGKLYVVDKVNRPDRIILRKKKCKKCGHKINTMEFEVIDDKRFEDSWKAYHRLTILKEEQNNVD